MKAWRRKTAGLSLVEALVAMAVMSIGMLGIVGMQSTLRGNADVARQRAEALRLGQQEIETWRGYVMPAAGGSGIRFDDLVSGSWAVPAAAGISNADFTVTRTVTDWTLPLRGKTLAVQVTWNDRNGEAQQVRLSTQISRVDPLLAGSTAVAAEGDLLRTVGGRKRGLPPDARDLGDGTSGFLPPGAAPGVLWRFDNLTGTLTLCATTASNYGSLTSASITGCNSAVLLLPLSGFITYALGSAASPQPPALNNLDVMPPAPPPVLVVDYSANSLPPGTATCYTENHSGSSAADPGYTRYFCAVPAAPAPVNFSILVPLWGGVLRFVSSPTAALATMAGDVDANRLKACRYQSAATYTGVTNPLENQNYVMIRAGNAITSPPPATATPFTCPSPTRAHQP